MIIAKGIRAIENMKKGHRQHYIKNHRIKDTKSRMRQTGEIDCITLIRSNFNKKHNHTVLHSGFKQSILRKHMKKAKQNFKNPSCIYQSCQNEFSEANKVSKLITPTSNYCDISIFTSIPMFTRSLYLKSFSTLLEANIRLKLVVSNKMNLILLKRIIKIVSLAISHNKSMSYV